MGQGALLAFDGGDLTEWITQFTGGSPGYTYDLVVDLGAVYSLTEFRLKQRQSGGVNGMIGEYEFYVKTYLGTPPVVSLPPVPGEWTRGRFRLPKRRTSRCGFFGPSNSRYVRLHPLNEVQGVGNPWAALAEFNVLGTLE